ARRGNSPASKTTMAAPGVVPFRASSGRPTFGVRRAFIEGPVMRFALVIGVCLGMCLPLFAAAPASATEQAKAPAQDRPSAESVRQTYRARINDNTVTVMAGSAHGSDTE